jgi:hypothetical protein
VSRIDVPSVCLNSVLHCPQLRGYGMSADAHHITQPPPDGRGATLAMRRALEDAGAAALDVAHVNAHGTGTPLGDVAELRAIAHVFAGADAQQPQQEASTSAEPHKVWQSFLIPDFAASWHQGTAQWRLLHDSQHAPGQ